MNLKNNQITLGELLDHPGARALLQKRFSILAKHPPAAAARTVTLEQMLAFAQSFAPPKKVAEVLEELRRV